MPTRIINLPNTIPPSRIIFEDHFAEVLAAIDNASERFLAGVGQDVVTDARATGTYENRTGNLRRMITSNANHAKDDPETYPGTDVVVTESDGKVHKRKQFSPPADFDETKVERRSENELVVTVAAIMPYAAAQEARGNAVLSQSVDKVVAETNRTNRFQVRATDLTDRTTRNG